MRKIWNFLFENDRHIDEYRGIHQRDIHAEIFFLSRTGITLDAIEGVRRPTPKTGEFDLRNY